MNGRINMLNSLEYRMDERWLEKEHGQKRLESL
jgi:hypothetical protein